MILATRAVAAVLLATAALGGCVAPVGPVEVTRFHDATLLDRVGRGTIAVEPAAGMDPASLELRSYQSAVARRLVTLGYREAPVGSGGQVALVRLQRTAFRPGRDGSPVSVGVGGGGGSYGSGVGMGIGIDLSGASAEQVTTELGDLTTISAFRIDRASGKTVWEGRARFTVRASSPLADTQLGAAKMAEALFANFPGNSGETIQVQ